MRAAPARSCPARTPAPRRPDANGTPLAFEFALNGDNLTLALENGTVQMFRCTLENGLMYLTPMSNNGAYQAFTDVFRQTESTSGEAAN